MQVQRRALYNSLRIKWLEDPEIQVQHWQIDDYRNFSKDILFLRLKELGIGLNEDDFINHSENFNNPEDFVDYLAEDDNNNEYQDKVYLLCFELWRRIIPYKPSISIFCDELDFQICLYDQEESNIEDIQNVLIGLKDILEDNAEQENPVNVLNSISDNCANDLEAFLYDFIIDQIDEENYDYASELVDDFYDYVSDVKWFQFLRIRLMALSDLDLSEQLLMQFIEDFIDDLDSDLLFDVLGFMAENGVEESFVVGVNAIMPLLENEGDFQELLQIVMDYYSTLNVPTREAFIEGILSKRKKCDPVQSIDSKDSDVALLLDLLKSSDSIFKT